MDNQKTIRALYTKAISHITDCEKRLDNLEDISISSYDYVRGQIGVWEIVAEFLAGRDIEIQERYDNFRRAGN
jgi:hypothetical protein